MSTFVSPFAAGVVPALVTPAATIPAGRFAGDRLWWTGVPAGTAVNAFATGAVLRAEGATGGLPGSAGSPWTLFQLSPLPQMDGTHFKAVRGGLPVQLVVVAGNGGPGPASDDCLIAGASLVTAPAGAGNTAFVAFAFQDRLCRDPLTALEAIAASGAADANWTALVSAVGALPGARTLRALDHRGAPLRSGTFHVVVGGTPHDVDLTTLDGDTGITVGPAASAVVSCTSAPNAIVAAGPGNDGAFAQALALAPGARIVQMLDAAQWFAQPDPGVSLPRWNANSLVEPIVEGNPYFARLVDDLRAAKPGGGHPAGAAQLAGWAFVKGSLDDDTIEWPLIPGDDTTRILALVSELHGSAVPMKFLVNQFLTFDVNSLDDAPWLLLVIMGLYGLLGPGVLLGVATDPAGFGVGAAAVIAALIVYTTPAAISFIKSKAEYSKPFVDALQAIDPALFTWTPYPARFEDNPLLGPPPFKVDATTIDDVDALGVYHQKHVSIKHADGTYVAYLGGIDINSDRPDDPRHRAAHPFHDVQVRITGPAAKDVITSFQERLAYHEHGATAPIDPGSVGTIPDAGSHLVQIARTYFKHQAGSASVPFPFAPNGETTPVRTIEAAIGQAKDFIYVEDQYFTPPDDYVNALIAAAARTPPVRALFLTMPYQTDQPFGWRRRADVLAALQTAWTDRLHVGTPLRRFMIPTPALTTNLGRARLASALAKGALTAELTPLSHVPLPPFWAFVEGELILFYAPSGGPSGTGADAKQAYEIARAGGGTGWDASQQDHDAGAPVTAVQIPGIYVHAKMMIVDDVFLSVGSSNLNRRGFYHDGEMSSFTVPQHLAGDPRNPARVLRSRLMAEHAGLSPEIGLSLFADPFAYVPYAKRSWYTGAHNVGLDFFGTPPPNIPIGTTDSIVGELLKIAMGVMYATAEGDAWKLLVDPTTTAQPMPRVPGPRFP